jgi:metallo-beta-lactamase family protein
MAISATELYRRATSEHDDEAKARYDLKGFPLEPATVTYVRDREQSKELNQRRGPMAIIAGSGMATGGRIAHHILHRASDPTTIILFTGYQAEGTLGRKLLEGENPVYIHHQEIHVAGRVEKLNSLSAHADQGEMLRWLHGFETPPRETFLVHGEYDVQQRLKAKIEEEFGWRVTIPEWKERVSL